MYSSCCCSCSFEAEIIKISQSSHKMYSNDILNFQEFTTILNACTEKVRKRIDCTTYIYINIYRERNRERRWIATSSAVVSSSTFLFCIHLTQATREVVG